MKKVVSDLASDWGSVRFRALVFKGTPNKVEAIRRHKPKRIKKRSLNRRTGVTLINCMRSTNIMHFCLKANKITIAVNKSNQKG